MNARIGLTQRCFMLRGLNSPPSESSAMYNPSHFVLTDLPHIFQLIAEQPLALLVGPDAAGDPFVTHVPLTVQQDEQGWLLEGHMARANPQWAWLSAQARVLAVFNGPSAYVSPQHYDSPLNVPTWNYLAVHVYGDVELVEDAAGKDGLLKRLIAQHEPAYAAQWRSLPTEYQQKMLSAIVGFRLRVTRCEAKAKLSQNRPLPERTRIATQFGAATASANEQALALWMARLGISPAPLPLPPGADPHIPA
ncbi:FMN-binding negative transcriptional regulator [Roseateles sp. GG27B]